MKFLHLFVFLLLAATIRAGQATTFTMRRFEGTIGSDLQVTLHLTRLAGGSENEYSGQYCYQRRGEPIYLEIKTSGTGETLTMKELAPPVPGKPDAPQQYTGTWTVESGANSTLSGTWQSADGKRTLPVALKESYPPGSFRFKLHQLSRQARQGINGEENGEEKSAIFPQLEADTPVARRINTAIRAAVHASIAPVRNGKNRETPDLAGLTKAFFSGTPDHELPGPESFSHVYTYDFNWDVGMNDDGILVIEHHWSDFTGGMHGNYGFSYLTFDALTGQPLELSAITLPGYKKRWPAAGAAALRREQALPATAPLQEAGLFEDKLELNETWCVLPHGIQFSYDPYEIGCYARRQITFTLPWKDILADLKPGTPVHALARKRTAP